MDCNSNLQNFFFLKFASVNLSLYLSCLQDAHDDDIDCLEIIGDFLFSTSHSKIKVNCLVNLALATLELCV